MSEQVAGLVTTERVGKVVWLLAVGGQYTTRELSARLGIAPDGVRKMMDRLSAVIPIYQDDGGVWCVAAPPHPELMGVMEQVEREKARLAVLKQRAAAMSAKLQRREQQLVCGVAKRCGQRGEWDGQHTLLPVLD